MKIEIVNYMPGEARFVIEGIPGITYCVPLQGVTKKKEVLDALKAQVQPPGPDIDEETFNKLKLQELEGTDI